MRFKPIHGILVVLAFVGAVVAAELAVEGRLGQGSRERVSPDRDGLVRIAAEGLAPRQVRFFRFLNPSNQEVPFFVGRDDAGHLQVAFDANEPCAKAKRGYRHEGEWVVCNKCDKAFRLSEVNEGRGGCYPVPLKFREEGGELILAEADILTGWRLFQ
ncbi:MAG TPA: Fe-S-containing protein [Thermoanaerobaculia bacterium]|nr:Fe-S-containing protein [Thermoanaerobaculia bacterium]